MTRVIFTVAFAFLASMSTIAFAHPGHGTAASTESGYSLWHYLSEPTHAVVVLTLAVGLVTTVVVTRSRRMAAAKG
jgi:hypothetical protein